MRLFSVLAFASLLVLHSVGMNCLMSSGMFTVVRNAIDLCRALGEGNFTDFGGLAAVVSIRYATVRRQGNSGRDGLESQVINYPAVYHRLLPILSRAYVYTILGPNLVRTHNKREKFLTLS